MEMINTCNEAIIDYYSNIDNSYDNNDDNSIDESVVSTFTKETLVAEK